MAKTKVKKLNRKQIVWKKYCELPILDKYELVMEVEDMYDEFELILNNYRDFYSSLRELEKEVDRRAKLAKGKR